VRDEDVAGLRRPARRARLSAGSDLDGYSLQSPWPGGLLLERSANREALVLEGGRAQVTIASRGRCGHQHDRRRHITNLNPVAESMTGWSWQAGIWTAVLQDVLRLIDGELAKPALISRDGDPGNRTCRRERKLRLIRAGRVNRPSRIPLAPITTGAASDGRDRRSTSEWWRLDARKDDLY